VTHSDSTISKLIKSSWWSGPKFLQLNPEEWPRDITHLAPPLPILDPTAQIFFVSMKEEPLLFGIELHKYNDLLHLLHVTAYVIRFLRCQCKKEEWPMLFQFLCPNQQAEIFWVQIIQ